MDKFKIGSVFTHIDPEVSWTATILSIGDTVELAASMNNGQVVNWSWSYTYFAKGVRLGDLVLIR